MTADQLPSCGPPKISPLRYIWMPSRKAAVTAWVPSSTKSNMLSEQLIAAAASEPVQSPSKKTGCVGGCCIQSRVTELGVSVSKGSSRFFHRICYILDIVGELMNT